MSLQRIGPQQFRGTQLVTVPGIPTSNCTDFPNFSNVSAPAYQTVWSPGSTLVDQANLQGVGQHWKLLSIAVQASLLHKKNSPCWGKLGRIFSAVDPTGITPSTGGGSTPNVLPLPSDATLITTLWDPTINDLPPDINISDPENIGTAQNPGLPISSVISLPVPLPVEASVQVTIGLWIFPSLITAPFSGAGTPPLQIYIVNGKYTLNFDDGS